MEEGEDFFGVERKGNKSGEDKENDDEDEDNDDDDGGEMMPIVDVWLVLYFIF